MNDSQALMYKTLQKRGPACNGLLSALTGKDAHKVSPRINELRAMGLVELSHKDQYPYGRGRTVSWWKVTDVGNVQAD